jgi:hypothetical protein
MPMNVDTMDRTDKSQNAELSWAAPEITMAMQPMLSCATCEGWLC